MKSYGFHRAFRRNDSKKLLCFQLDLHNTTISLTTSWSNAQHRAHNTTISLTTSWCTALTLLVYSAITTASGWPCIPVAICFVSLWDNVYLLCTIGTRCYVHRYGTLIAVGFHSWPPLCTPVLQKIPTVILRISSTGHHAPTNHLPSTAHHLRGLPVQSLPAINLVLGPTLLSRAGRLYPVSGTQSRTIPAVLLMYA